MSSRSEGPGNRIVVDAQELRDASIRMRGAAALLSSAGRQLALRHPPAMPPGVGSLVAETLYRANAELQELAAELIEEAHDLTARATWAELGGGGSIAWLLPGLRHPSLRSTPASGPLLPSAPEGQTSESSEWAVRLLETMGEPAADRSSFDPAAFVERFAEADAAQAVLPDAPSFAGFSLASGPPDAYDGSTEAIPGAEVVGALGHVTGNPDASGAGVLGCMFVGLQIDEGSDGGAA